MACKEVEPLFRRAVEIGERALGKDDPNVATGYNNLAELLRTQGKYDQAELLYRRAIEIGERVLGKDHPDVARDYSNLALLLHAQGKYEQAEPLYRRAIEINETVLGKDPAPPSSVMMLRRFTRSPHRRAAEETMGRPALAVQSRSVMESAMLMLYSGRLYGTARARLVTKPVCAENQMASRASVIHGVVSSPARQPRDGTFRFLGEVQRCQVGSRSESSSSKR
jgi:tetratricopeptide (TPR) repeat protein